MPTARKKTATRKRAVKQQAEKKAEWTVMIFMAPDEHLEVEVAKDFADIKQSGSTDEVHFLAQYDSAQKGISTKRYRLRHGTTIKDDIVQDLEGETNAGDINTLLGFLRWGIKRYPAKRYMLILWGHGGGWSVGDIWHEGQKAPETTARVSEAMKKALKGQQLESPAAVLPDHDTGDGRRAFDYLDSLELREAFQRIQKTLKRKFDIVGFDNCMMGMLEGAYHFHKTVQYVIASSEEIEKEGWPYREICRYLVDHPRIKAAEFAVEIARIYEHSYKMLHKYEATLAALRLSKADEVTNAVGGLAEVLCRKLNPQAASRAQVQHKKGAATAAKKRVAKRSVDAMAAEEFPTASPQSYKLRTDILAARKHVQEFNIDGFLPVNIDLVNFCQLLRQNSDDRQVRAACTRVINKIKGGFVLYAATSGYAVKYSNGVSIYFPIRKEPGTWYTWLAFDNKARWYEFIKTFLDDAAWSDFIKYEIFYAQQHKVADRQARYLPEANADSAAGDEA